MENREKSGRGEVVMCSRYGALNSTRIARFARDLGAQGFDIEHRELISVGSHVPIILPDLTTTAVKWGFTPSWSKSLLFNARIETVAEKRSFSRQFRDSRCLMPLDCWYESPPGKQYPKPTYRFTRVDYGPMAMAGLYYSGEPAAVVSLTMPPNSVAAEIHNRMPVVIPAALAHQWLTGSPAEALASALPLPAADLIYSRYR